jgi:PAS domain S-box-containing protein
MVENAPDMVTVLDVDGCVRFESRGVETQLGWRRDELVGRNAFELIHPDDHARIASALEMGRNGPSVPFSARYRFRQRDGAWRPLESVARYVQDAGWFVIHSRTAGGAVRD